MTSSKYTYCSSCAILNPPKQPVPVLPQRDVWADFNPEELYHIFAKITETTSSWMPNLFVVPFGREGQNFLDELTKLAKLFSTDPDSECYALSALVLAPTLLLQKTSNKAKAFDNKQHLARRLEMWKLGKFEDLVNEGKALQKPLSPRDQTEESCLKKFIQLMKNGQISEATGWLDPGRSDSGVKEVTQDVLNDLEAKHPPSSPISSCAADHGPPKAHIPQTFDSITGDVIYNCTRGMKGSAGPGGLDSTGIKRMLCSRKFKRSTTELREALALVARSLATKKYHPRFLATLCASRLIPLKKPDNGTRPIGIGETLRRVICKAVMKSQRREIRLAAGKFQMAAGVRGGCEAAVHSLRQKFESDECDAVLLLDAQNAFNTLNRKLTLHHVSVHCPILDTFLSNIYGCSRDLWVGESVLTSEEGATQGCPSAMGMYSIGISPLIEKVKEDDVFQIFFADDGNGCGKLDGLYAWYRSVVTKGPAHGYIINPNKCVLIVKIEHLSEAEDMFSDTGVTITTTGNRHLGAVIGSETFKKEYVSDEVAKWAGALRNLVKIAKTDPHVAYVNYTRSFHFKWSYMQRTVPGIGPLFEPLEEIIRHEFLPTLLGTHVSDLQRELIALPARLGGLGIENPVLSADTAYEHSLHCTGPLVEHLLSDEELDGSTIDNIDKITKERTKECEERTTERHLVQMKSLKEKMTEKDRRLLSLNQEPGASSWLTARPIEAHGHHLTKQEFVDAMHLRFGLPFLDLPAKCPCGTSNSADHALSCHKGGYTIYRHDRLRDSFADILSHAGVRAIETEKLLQPCDEYNQELQPYPWANTDRDARMDIVCMGLWAPDQMSYMDVRVCHPMAASYLNTKPSSLYKTHEKSKKTSYMRRVQIVEGGTFSPLVFTTTGGVGPEMNRAMKKVAKLLEDHGEMYSEALAAIRRRLRFCLLIATLRSLRGCRTKYTPAGLENIDFNL